MNYDSRYNMSGHINSKETPLYILSRFWIVRILSKKGDNFFDSLISEFAQNTIFNDNSF
jgi:hypothetical protein